jgi:hypothetical protein
MPGRLILASLRDPLPNGCDLYIAATRTMPRPVVGWKWNERLRELGPPPSLHARALVWKQSASWPKRWPDYEQEYWAWMARDPCASLLAALEQRVREGILFFSRHDFR